MQRIHKTGTAGNGIQPRRSVPETPAETVEDPAESSTTIVPAGPGSDIGPGHGPIAIVAIIAFRDKVSELWEAISSGINSL